jgi:polyisoprenoid-binding protein YceI
MFRYIAKSLFQFSRISKKWLLVGALSATSATMTSGVNAEDYTIDTLGAHAFIQFRIKHLGYSWLYGRFNKFEGEFSYDEKDPQKNKVSVDIDVTSIDSMHAERDKHLRGAKFLNTDKFPTAKFVSTQYVPTGEGTADLIGNLTLHGVTKSVTISVEHIGGGKDPWGGYRNGFAGSLTITAADFNLDLVKSLGADAAEVEMMLSVEGILKK